MNRFNTLGTAVRALALAAVLSLAAPGANAQIVAYSNTATLIGAFSNGNATPTAGNTITSLVADDLSSPLFAAGQFISAFTFSVGNANLTAVSARPRIRFYAGDGASNGPGTFLGGFSFNPISFAAGTAAGTTVSTFTATLTTANYVSLAPITNNLLWAGITFDDNTGATGATAAQLNNLGQGIFNPPTAGTSQDTFFRTTAAGSFLANNPIGTFSNFSGSPVANFGWSITVVPESGTPALLAACLPALAAVIVARRRKTVA